MQDGTSGPSWPRVAAGVAILVLAVQAGATIHASIRIGRAERRIGKIERTVKDIEKAQASAGDIEDLEAEVALLDEEIRNLRTTSLFASSKLKRLGLKIEDLESYEADLTEVFPELDSLIQEKVDSKLASGKDVGRLPTMQTLSEKLGMTPFQEQKTKEIFDRAKYDAFGIVNTPREDGTSLLDEVTDVMLHSQNPRQDGTRVMMKLFYENVPGTDETYFQKLKQLQTDTQDGVTGVMDESQAATYNSMDVNVFGVQTGYNPLADYFKSYIASHK